MCPADAQPYPPPHNGFSSFHGNGYSGVNRYNGSGGGYPTAPPAQNGGGRPSWPSAQPAYNGGSYAPFKV